MIHLRTVDGHSGTVGKIQVDLKQPSVPTVPLLFNLKQPFRLLLVLLVLFWQLKNNATKHTYSGRKPSEVPGEIAGYYHHQPSIVHWKHCRNTLNLDNANMAQHCIKLIFIVSLFFFLNCRTLFHLDILPCGIPYARDI